MSMIRFEGKINSDQSSPNSLLQGHQISECSMSFYQIHIVQLTDFEAYRKALK